MTTVLSVLLLCASLHVQHAIYAAARRERGERG